MVSNQDSIETQLQFRRGIASKTEVYKGANLATASESEAVEPGYPCSVPSKTEDYSRSIQGVQETAARKPPLASSPDRTKRVAVLTPLRARSLSTTLRH